MNQFLSFLSALNWADYVVILIVAYTGFKGIKRGFMKETTSLITWILALILSVEFYKPLSNTFESVISTASTRMILAFIAIFIAVLIVGTLTGALLTKLIKMTGLSLPNRIAGMLFGIVKGFLIIVLLVILAKFTALPKDEWWKKSVLIPHAEKVADIL